jgi:dethiobiotin synthetase
MRRGYFVTGTDTGVGKTLVACALLHGFARAGLSTVGMKPVAAGHVESESGFINEDVAALCQASSVHAARELINPYAFARPIAPHIAAAQEGTAIDVAHIRRAFEALARVADAVIVEGVGGFRVPICSGADSADLAVLLDLPIILVVGLRLGCLNHALLTAEAVERRGLSLAGWVANHVEAQMLEADANVAALQERLSCPLLGRIPHQACPDPRELSLSLPA